MSSGRTHPDLGTLDVEQVAELIGASVWWVAEQARQRRVTHLRFSRGSVRFRRQDIVALMELAAVAATVPTTSETPERSEVAATTNAPDDEAQRVYQLAIAAGRPRRAALAAARKIRQSYTA